MAQAIRQKQDKNSKPLTQIDMPLHLYFESQLEQLHKYFTEKGDKAGLALVEPELAQRRADTLRLQELTGIAPQPDRVNPNLIREDDKGRRGAHWNIDKQKWSSKIQHKNKITILGYFDTKEECFDAYYNAYLEIHNKKPW